MFLLVEDNTNKNVWSSRKEINTIRCNVGRSH